MLKITGAHLPSIGRQEYDNPDVATPEELRDAIVANGIGDAIRCCSASSVTFRARTVSLSETPAIANVASLFLTRAVERERPGVLRHLVYVDGSAPRPGGPPRAAVVGRGAACAGAAAGPAGAGGARLGAIVGLGIAAMQLARIQSIKCVGRSGRRVPMAMMVGDVLVVVDDVRSDAEREWVTRFNAWLLIAIVMWTALCTLVLYGPQWAAEGWQQLTVAGIGGVSGLFAVLLAKDESNSRPGMTAESIR